MTGIITSKQLRQILSIDMLTAMKIVKNYYPEILLINLKKIQSITERSSQCILKSILIDLFPNEIIMEDYNLVNSDNLQLDYYLPNLKLAFEYQVIYFVSDKINWLTLMKGRITKNRRNESEKYKRNENNTFTNTILVG